MPRLDLLGYLPVPASTRHGSGSSCSFKLFGDRLIAYASGSAVVIGDVETLETITMLVGGGHVNAVVTALDWYPIGYGEETPGPCAALLASGDALGKAIVWDTCNAEPVAVLGDAGLVSGFGNGKNKIGIKSIAWVTFANILAILLEHGKLLLWDCKNGNVVWKRDFGSDSFSNIQTNPNDRRQVVMNTDDGVFGMLQIDSALSGSIEYKRYQAEISPGGRFTCWLPGVHGIAVLLLDREFIFFDLEIGQSLGSVSLSKAMPTFVGIIGSFGHATGNASFFEKGIDVILCHHADSSISTWQREGKELSYKMISHYGLMSPTVSYMHSKATADISISKRFVFLAALPGLKTGDMHSKIDLEKRPWYPSSIFLLGMSDDGRFLKWEIDGSGLVPCLISMHASNSGSITSLSVYPGLVKLSGNITSPLIACGTDGGKIEVYSMTKSRMTRLLFNLTKSFSIGDGEIKGLSWMSKIGKIVFYQSLEVKESSSGDKSLSFRNRVLMIDVLTGQTDTIRSTIDSGEITGLRVSPTGAYVLVVCSGMASEIWTTLYLDSPFRLRQIDLPFSTVEWLPEGFGLPCGKGSDGKENTNHVDLLSSTMNASFDLLDDLPEEMLHFSLRDSRLGILLVKGRKIQDARPVVSNWAPLVTGEFQAHCAAAFGSYIFLGGNDGTLARWDTKSGDTVAVETGCAKVVRIQVSGPKSDGALRLSLLSSSGTFAVLVMDSNGRFKSSKITWTTGYSLVGTAKDLAWAILPEEYGGRGESLLLQLREGSLALLDYGGVKGRLLDSVAGTLVPQKELPCSILVPSQWLQLFCVLIQLGITMKTLKQCLAVIGESSLQAAEDSILKILPDECVEHVLCEKETRATRRGHGSPDIALSPKSMEDELPKGSLAELLKNRTSLGEDPSVGSPLATSEQRNSSDKAAYALGYRMSSSSGLNEVSETLKSIGGSFRDIAAAGKEKVQKKLGSKDSASQHYGDHYPENTFPSSPAGARTISSAEYDLDRNHLYFNTLTEVIVALASLQNLQDSPIGHLEEELLLKCEQRDTQLNRSAMRMALSARLRLNREEERFWIDLSKLLGQRDDADSKTEDALGPSPLSSSSIWDKETAINLLIEISCWHSNIPKNNIENAEDIAELFVLEQICLGDVETAVSMLLATPPSKSARFYRDAMCSLGMAYACASEHLQREENDLAGSLFVQAARVIAMNAATSGDSLVGVPLLYATSKYDEVIDILQQNSMWSLSATLAAQKLSADARKRPLENVAQHVSTRKGLVWQAVNILIGTEQYTKALDTMLTYHMYDRAKGLLEALDEAQMDVIDEEKRERVNSAFTVHANRLISDLLGL